MTTVYPYDVAYAVTYDASTDSFIFTFAATFSPVSVARIGFTYINNVDIANGVTFFSDPGCDGCAGDGITVRWTLASAPAGAVSALSLYTLIQALYVPPVSTPLTAIAPIAIDNTIPTSPVVYMVDSGAAAGSYTLMNGTVTLKGVLSSAASATSGDVITTLGYTPEDVADKDAANGYAGLTAASLLKAAEFPAISATGDVTGTSTAGTVSIPLSLPNVGTAGTYAAPSSITTDAKGRLTSVTAGTGAALPYLVANRNASTTPTIAAGGDAVVDYATIGISSSGMSAYLNTTTGVFTPTVAGVYDMSGAIVANNSSGGVVNDALIRYDLELNGTVYSYSYVVLREWPAGQSVALCTTGKVSLNGTTDNANFRIYNFNTGTIDLAALPYTLFQVNKIA